jgi:hypothetical protein
MKTDTDKAVNITTEILARIEAMNDGSATLTTTPREKTIDLLAVGIMALIVADETGPVTGADMLKPVIA